MKLYLHAVCDNNHNNCNGTLAQLVEQRTENPCVPGSIPGGTTLKSRPSRSGFFSLRFCKFESLIPFDESRY